MVSSPRAEENRAMKKVLGILMILCWAPGTGISADGWVLDLRDLQHGPRQFLAIDKREQFLLLFEQQSPLKLVRRYPCATGRSDGDKYIEGDLRTPEGVYFIERNLSSGLDYELFGEMALTLNFPNPVDRVNGKSGHGIWIHGRGQPIVPNETRGCIALNTSDLRDLKGQLQLGSTPVIIAQRVLWQPARNALDATSRELAGVVDAWAAAWQDKSERFFSYYDSERFVLGQTGSFSKFRRRKARLFQELAWIRTHVSDLQLVPGPGYWVACFRQIYQSPHLASEGVKRLYWMTDASGRWRIVGEEFRGLRASAERAETAIDSSKVSEWVESWRAAWEEGNLQLYLSFYRDDAAQDARRGRSAIAGHKSRLWEKEKPKAIRFGPLDIKTHAQGIMVRFEQQYLGRSGYVDRGRKTLVVEPRGDRWLIIDEQWSAR